jgi:MFS family permease
VVSGLCLLPSGLAMLALSPVSAMMSRRFGPKVSLCTGSLAREELAAANGLNSLSRTVGSSLASAIGGTVLASSVIVLGAIALPSLTAYRVLFGICAGAAVLGAAIALVVPKPQSQAA